MTFMYDHGWNTQFTEFDIVGEGDVPLLMSLPQMRTVVSLFDLTPDKACLSCARIVMRKVVLKTAMSTNLIVDLQNSAWYMNMSRHHRSKVSLHDTITLSTVRLLCKRMFNTKLKYNCD